jgi:hypothetical protein
MHTKDYLAQELRAAGLEDLATLASTGYFHDFLSPLDFPEMALAQALENAGTPAARALLKRHMNGEFDASAEEGEDWAASEDGQDAMRRLIKE